MFRGMKKCWNKVSEIVQFTGQPLSNQLCSHEDN